MMYAIVKIALPGSAPAAQLSVVSMWTFCPNCFQNLEQCHRGNAVSKTPLSVCLLSSCPCAVLYPQG